MLGALRASAVAALFAGFTLAQAAAQPDPLKDCRGGAGAHDAIIAACTKVIQRSELEPFIRAQAYSYRSTARRAKQQYEEAIADLGRAIELTPHHMFYFNRAETYRITARIDQAKADFREVLKRDPGNVHASQKLRELGEQVPRGGSSCSGPLCTMY